MKDINKIEKILKKFDEEFGIEYPFNNPLSGSARIKEFIRTSITDLLSKKGEEIEQALEEKKIEDLLLASDRYVGLNQGLDLAKQIIKKHLKVN